MSIDTQVEAIRDQHGIPDWIWAGIFKLVLADVSDKDREEYLDRIFPLKKTMENTSTDK